MRKVLIKNNLEEVSEAAAGLFVAMAIESIATRGKFSVALAGGSTPRALYSLLASEKYRNKVQWPKLSFFFGDERNVPPDSSESNFRMANENLLAPLGIASKTVHRWKTELNPPEAASEYEREMQANGPVDLVLRTRRTHGFSIPAHGCIERTRETGGRELGREVKRSPADHDLRGDQRCSRRDVSRRG